MINLFNKIDLKWVEFPKEYLQLKASTNSQNNFLPWYILQDDDKINFWAKYLRKTYKRDLYPIARKDATDDFACWENGNGVQVNIIHTFASPGWEQRETFKNFDEWYQWALTQEY